MTFKRLITTMTNFLCDSSYPHVNIKIEKNKEEEEEKYDKLTRRL